MKTRRKLSCFILVIAFLIGIFTITPNQTQAASKYKVVNVTNTTKKMGNVTFSSQFSTSDNRWYVYYKKNDKKYLLTNKSDVSTIIMTDGKKVYYSVKNRFEKSFDDYYELIQFTKRI